MSPEQDTIRLNAEPHITETPMIDTGSYNGCSVTQADSDSASDSDSRERRILADQTAEGLAAIVERFWSKVDRSGECWLWTASAMDTSGHGQFTIRDANRKQHHLYAHRVAWALAGLNVGHNLKLCHTCDVASCVRPSHLFVGTQQDNLSDARQKGRLIDGIHLIKVSDDGLADIKAHYRPRINGKELAHRYGISVGSVLRIVAGTQRRPNLFLNNVVALAPDEFQIPCELVRLSRQRDQSSQSVHARDCAEPHTSSVRSLSGQLSTQHRGVR